VASFPPFVTVPFKSHDPEAIRHASTCTSDRALCASTNGTRVPGFSTVVLIDEDEEFGLEEHADTSVAKKSDQKASAKAEATTLGGPPLRGIFSMSAQDSNCR